MSPEVTDSSLSKTGNNGVGGVPMSPEALEAIETLNAQMANLLGSIKKLTDKSPENPSLKEGFIWMEDIFNQLQTVFNRPITRLFADEY